MYPQQQTPLRLPVKILPHAAGLPLPAYQTPGSAALDLPAAVETPLLIKPGAVALVPTGLEVAVPDGYELQIRPRSGLAVHHGIGLLNSPGTVDSDYRGEVQVVMINLGQEPFIVRRGDRIAQMLLAPRPPVVLEQVEELPSTVRGSGGFGHTGGTGLAGDDKLKFMP